MKMPCKLCEKSIHPQKIDGVACTHSSFPPVFNGSVPQGMEPITFGLQAGLTNNPFFQIPQLNMMLTAYLLRGEKCTVRNNFNLPKLCT